MDLVVVPTVAGLLVGDPATGERLLSWDEAATWVADRPPATRWVWPDTASGYRWCLAAGIRVQRCHDLRLCHDILARAVPDPIGEGRAAAEPQPPRWVAPTPGVAPGRAPTLLDDLQAERPPTVSEVVDEHHRQLAALTRAQDPGRLRLLLAAESAGALIAAEMHVDGLPWDAARHDQVLTETLGPRPSSGMRPARLEALAAQIRELLHTPTLNPDSQASLLKALRQAGLDVGSTTKWELTEQDHPVIAPLLEYKRLARLLAANGWAWLDTWVDRGADGRADRFRTDYVPGGVVTGRWATSGGGALQIPRMLRGAVVADPGWCLVVADVAQVEPRVLAGMAGDLALARAGAGGDLYAGLVDSGVVETRDRAKVGMLSALYGGTAGEAGMLLPRLRRSYPRAIGLVDHAAQVGAAGGVVHTWLGRTSPPPGRSWREVQQRAGEHDADQSDERRARAQARDRGRFTRNFVVQGTAAEWALCWLAETRRRLAALEPVGQAGAPGQGRAHLVFFLHDEIVVHTPQAHAAQVEQIVLEAAGAAGRLLFGDFPITFPLHVSTVRSYAEADK